MLVKKTCNQLKMNIYENRNKIKLAFKLKRTYNSEVIKVMGEIGFDVLSNP